MRIKNFKPVKTSNLMALPLITGLELKTYLPTNATDFKAAGSIRIWARLQFLQVAITWHYLTLSRAAYTN